MADFLVPLYRYHDRWNELTEQDFTYQNWRKDYPYKGQYPILKVTNYKFPSDYMQERVSQDSEFVVTNEAISYFDKMIQVCKENDIEFVIVKTPVGSWDVEKHEIIKNYADNSDVEFIDFNLPELQEKISFEPSRDYCDDGRHPNITGAKKMSLYLGEYLDRICNFEDKRNMEEASFSDKSIGNRASIVIDGTEYSPQKNGFNVVVYDNVLGQVIARRAFDTGRTGKLCSY